MRAAETGGLERSADQGGREATPAIECGWLFVGQDLYAAVARSVIRNRVDRMTMTMLSFRADEEDVNRIRQWSQRLGVERSELMREALRRHLARLAAEHEVALYEAHPLTDEELALAAVADWGPAEDWSDWLDATR